ncbi:hypothetical protein [Marinomonas transparens]|uniref:ABC transmembrane type-1 domain-containing protein n=1 Tax=Marinomonas transparens TaxID=2795388 RepID=A0A934N3P4_9GAMM|nr:hypothetical protein [Marinomonas transparens]MBJ7539902.1 hypothetical protein [Marinomonas transparens]
MIELALFTVAISAISTLLAVMVAMVIAFLFDTSSSRIRRISFIFAQSLNAVPPTVVGIFVYYFCTQSSFFSGLIFSPSGMILGQFILALPISYVLFSNPILNSMHSIKSVLPKNIIGNQRVNFIRVVGVTLIDIRHIIVSNVFVIFGRLIGEVGTLLIIGGGIHGQTETLSTNIVMQIHMGDVESAMMSGIILLSIVVITRLAILFVEPKSR